MAVAAGSLLEQKTRETHTHTHTTCIYTQTAGRRGDTPPFPPGARRGFTLHSAIQTNTPKWPASPQSSSRDITNQRAGREHVHAIRPEPHLPRAAKTDCALARTKVGLGGLCWHTFEHNRTPEHNGKMEHKHETKIVTSI